MLTWLDGERAGLVAAVQWAREERFADTAIRLSHRLGEHLAWRRYFDDWITVADTAREAAHRAGDRLGEAFAWDDLGNALQEARRAEEAIDAHDLYQEADDRRGGANAWNNFGLTLGDAGRVTEAIEAYSRALEIYQEFEDWYRAGQALHNLATAPLRPAPTTSRQPMPTPALTPRRSKSLTLLRRRTQLTSTMRGLPSTTAPLRSPTKHTSLPGPSCAGGFAVLSAVAENLVVLHPVDHMLHAGADLAVDFADGDRCRASRPCEASSHTRNSLSV